MWKILKVSFDAWWIGFLVSRLDKALKRQGMFLMWHLGASQQTEQTQKNLNGMN